MTGDLISRGALSDKAEILYQHTDSGKIIPWSAVRVCAINNAPAVDAVPVVHGRWIDGRAVGVHLIALSADGKFRIARMRTLAIQNTAPTAARRWTRRATMHWTGWLLIVVGGTVMLAMLLGVCWAIQEVLAIHWAVLMRQGG